MSEVKQPRAITKNVSNESFDDIYYAINQRIVEYGDKPHVTVRRQLELLEQLRQFELGRFLLQNKNINGYWYHYLVTYPWYKQIVDITASELEKTMLQFLPTIQATQQKFKNILDQNQQMLTDNIRICSLPAEMMADLLYLDFSDISNIELVGVDTVAGRDALLLADKLGLAEQVKFVTSNTLELSDDQQFNLISCDGLNNYIQSHEQVVNLCKQVFNALAKDGKFVFSLSSFPVGYTNTDDWQVDKDALLLEKIILQDIIQVNWGNSLACDVVHSVLQQIGFSSINIIYDDAYIFPIITGTK